MAVGRISGPLLKENLIRNGIDLAFETDLLYLDVNNQRIGIKTTTPTHELQVSGTTKTTNLIIDTQAALADITIVGNTISSSQPYLNLGTLDNVVYQNKARIDSIDIEGNVISTNDSNANLEFRPNGTGAVEVYSDVLVQGNIHATGNITADGSITLGDADTDNVVFNAEIASDIIPDITNTYSLGSDPNLGGKEWNDVWVNNLVASSINSTALEVDGIDLTFRQGNIYYVAENGDDTNTGSHIQDPYASVAQALSSATPGDTVWIYPGVYTEVFPLTVPAGVTVKGQGLRAVTIQPTVGTNTNTAFLLNGETTIEDLMLTGFYAPGYAFEFAAGFTVTSRSPYIKNVTVITSGSVTTVEDPKGFNAGDAGGGAYIDGSVAIAGSKEASILFHAATFITPGVDAVTATNGVRVEWLNSFTYFANKSVYALDGTTGKYNDGKTQIRLGGVTGTFTPGNTITFTSADASTVVTATIESVTNDVITVDGKFEDLIGFDTTPQSISDGSATATTILNYDLRDFGAEIRMIGSASVYGNYGLYGDGPGVLVYAIGHNLAYIGTGKNVTNEALEVIQANEVVELNGAKVRYNSVDHKGDFRVGDLFYVNQESGTVNFAANNLNIDVTTGVTFTTGGNSTFINGERIDTGNLRISGNTIESLSGNINFSAFNDQIDLLNNVNITGNLDVTGNVTIGGNITIGNEASDTIQIVAGIDSDLVPRLDSTYSLGIPSKRWNNVWTNQANIDGLVIRDNYIETTTSNSDLELRASGTGKILIPNNNVQINNDLTVDGTATLANTNITGSVTLAGAFNQTGNTTVTGDIGVSQDLVVNATAQFEEILIDGNVITTTTSNSNLELRASGTGIILIPNNNVIISNNLTVDGVLNVGNIDSIGTIQANNFTTGDILIDDNFITTTISNSNLELRAAGTGNIVIDNFTFNNSTLTTPDNFIIQPGSGVVNIIGTGALTLPLGNTSERPTAATGQIRYNTELTRFEGYNGANWITLKGVEDLDGNTRVTAELTEGANDNTIRFIVENNTIVNINASRLAATKVIVDNIQLDGNVISTITADTDLVLDANGTGRVVIDNIAIKDNVILNKVSGSNTILQNTGTGYVEFADPYGIVLPVGDDTTRPAAATAGMVRYHSVDQRVELYDGTNWVSVAGASGGISFADAEDIALQKVLIFG
jgi:cytoskeletal protein CcmA (bactofilin family)